MLKKMSRYKKWTKLMIVFVVLVLNSAMAFSQNRITGTVKDSQGEPLIGVTIMEKGSTNGVTSDAEGRFSINIEQGKTLRFSIVGYENKEIKVAGTKLQIVMNENNALLKEVVVVGYGKMERKDVTSSITSIKAEDLNKGGVYSTPGQLLQGKVPGLTVTTSSNPTASPSVTLRGASTFRTGDAQEPYYVIDGIPGASLSLIAPDDIESIDVLRDASATAIYGSKAANGIIIVTTKKGKAGNTQVTYNGYLAVDAVAKRWRMLTGDEHRAVLAENNLSLNSADYIGDNTTNTNWQKEVQRTGFSYNHNVSIIGGNDNTNYAVSINYMKNEGVIKDTQLDKTTARSALNTKTLKGLLDLGFSLNVGITNYSVVPSDVEGRSLLDAMTYYLPESPVYNEDGTYFENAARSQYYNPVAMIAEYQNDTRKKYLQGVAKGTFHILPEWTLDANMAYQSETINNNLYYNIGSLLALGAGVGTDGYAQRYTLENTQKSLEVFSNYNKTFSNVHKFGAMAGYSWQKNTYDNGFQTSAKGFTSDQLGYYNLGIGSSSEMPNYGSIYYKELKMISFFGRLNYSYNSKYILQATIRQDGSSAFGANNRWGTFPSGSLAWRASEESFVKKLNLFDDLKFRVGYGVSGNSLGFDPLISKILYGKTGTFVNSQGQTVSAIGVTRNANPNLKWERTGMFNVGVDFGFFNNRLTGTIEYYNKRTSDLIADYRVSTTEYPYGWLTTNVGTISNKGVEFSINATPITTKKFTWNTSLNLSHNQNKVVSISNSEFSVDYFDEAELNAAGQTGAYQQKIIAGKPLGTFYTWKWAGYNDDGVSVFYTQDGNVTTTPTDDDRFYTGSAQPKLTFGWNNVLTYKNWGMTLFFTGLTGNKVLNATYASLSRLGSTLTQRNALKSAIEENKVSDYNSHFLSDRYIEKGDYIRLSNVNISYTFKGLSDYIKALKIYGSCNNVFVLTGYKGLDPEVNLGGLTPGIDNKDFYPKTRTFMFGASLTF